MGWQQPRSARSRCLGKSDEQVVAAAWRDIELGAAGHQTADVGILLRRGLGLCAKNREILLVKWLLAGAASRAHSVFPFLPLRGHIGPLLFQSLFYPLYFLARAVEIQSMARTTRRRRELRGSTSMGYIVARYHFHFL
jgi:hypothetical protein